MSNPNNYWFKRRRYGWGFVPVTWQGWLLIVDFVVLAIGGAVLILPAGDEQATTFETLRYIAYMLVLIGILFYISVVRGPKPRWRWGTKPSDNPDEDF